MLLPGPVVQPSSGNGFYPNGFIENNTLYLGYSYYAIYAAMVSSLPDFKEPFLLPRGGRSGLVIDGNSARFEQRQATLGLVLTEALTYASECTLEFSFYVELYRGQYHPLLTIGGKTRNGTVLRLTYDKAAKQNILEAVCGSETVRIGQYDLKTWTNIKVTIRENDFSIAVNGAKTTVPIKLLRKIAFGGLYEAPEWPMGTTNVSDVRIDLDSINVSR